MFASLRLKLNWVESWKSGAIIDDNDYDDYDSQVKQNKKGRSKIKTIFDSDWLLCMYCKSKKMRKKVTKNRHEDYHVDDVEMQW